MALAHIFLKDGSSYTNQKTGKVYKHEEQVLSTSGSEIAWAKSNGYFRVVDLEQAAVAAKKALEEAKAFGGKKKTAKPASEPETELEDDDAIDDEDLPDPSTLDGDL